MPWCGFLSALRQRTVSEQVSKISVASLVAKEYDSHSLSSVDGESEGAVAEGGEVEISDQNSEIRNTTVYRPESEIGDASDNYDVAV